MVVIMVIIWQYY